MSLRYPERYKPVKIPGLKKGIFLTDKLIPDDVLYVVPLDSRESPDDVLKQLQGKIPAAVKELSGAFEWKQVGPAISYSSRDKNAARYYAYNGKALIEFEHHPLELMGRSVLVGYGKVLVKEREAAEVWKGAEPRTIAYASKQSCSWLVSGISGEKVADIGKIGGITVIQPPSPSRKN